MKKRNNPSKKSIEKIVKKDPKFECFLINRKEKGTVICSIDNSIIRGYESDMVKHIKTKNHKIFKDSIEKSGSIINFLKKRKLNDEFFLDEENENYEKENIIFNINYLIHLISNQIPITTIDNLLTKNFIQDLNKFNLLKGKTLERDYLTKAFDYSLIKIKNLIENQYYSILFDSTIDEKGFCILIFCLTTKDNFFTLKFIVLDEGISINSDIIVNNIELILNDFNLEKKNLFQ